jgi:hypothetical protein
MANGMPMNALARQVIAAHGGMERWRRVRELHARVRCGGAALMARLQPNAYRHYHAVVDTRSPRITFAPFKGHRGVFTPERVWIETDRGGVLRERRNPRAYFPSWRRHLFWDALDVLYFGGYAMWNYLCTPFLWGAEGIALTEGAPWREGEETWRSLQVRFASQWATHSPEQIFYIDANGWIRRHDYTARIIGPYARAAHYSDDHRSFDGIVFPTRRRVYPRRGDNRSMPLPTLIWIDVDGIDVVDV